MMTVRKLILAIAATVSALVLSLSCWAQDSPQSMVRIDFTNAQDASSNFQMSLPLSMIELLKPQIEEILASASTDSASLQETWKIVRNVGPSEVVEIRNENADLKVTSSETELLVQVVDKKDGSKSLVTVPIILGDAFLSTPEPDWHAVARVVLSMNGADLVRISGDKVNGRAWIE